MRRDEVLKLTEEAAKTDQIELGLGRNPRKSPLLEIAENGGRAILECFKSLEAEKQPVNEVKILLVGEAGAGKTSLVKRLLGEKFDNNEPKTYGINIKKGIKIDGNDEIKVNLWDFGGEEERNATHQFFLSKRSLYVLVLDARKDEKTEYWLKHIEIFGGNSPILVVINKIDENPSFNVDRSILQDKYKSIKSFHHVSCKENKGIRYLTKTLIDELAKVELRQELFAKSWFNVKTKLEHMQDNFISYETFQELCIQENITGESVQETLIGFLNDLGIILHFKDFQLKHMHVLEPKWLTGAVYRIINSEKVAKNNGVLKLNSLTGILKKDDEPDNFYQQDEHTYIINVMKKFKLCYEIESDCILIPDALEIQEPDFDFNYSSSLKFLIDYDFLPKSVMPRFIVEMYKGIRNNLRWRTGVVLEDPTSNSIAVVKADENDKKIYIFVDGEQKRDYFYVIRHKFREINNRFEKMEATERVPLPDEPEITVSYKHLITLEKKCIKRFIPEGSEKEYNVKDLLGIIYVENADSKEMPKSTIYSKENYMGNKIIQNVEGDYVGDNIINGVKKGDNINKSNTSGNIGISILMIAAAIVAVSAIYGIFTDIISETTGSIIIVACFGGEIILNGKKNS